MMFVPATLALGVQIPPPVIRLVGKDASSE